MTDRADRAFRALLIGAIALALWGIGFALPVYAQEMAFLRVIHASPDAPAVDIYFDAAPEPAITNLAFGAATDFIQVPAKTYDITLRATGSAGNSTPVYEAKGIELPAGVSANVIAVGLVASQGAQAFGLRIFVTDRGPTNGKSRLEIIHASPDASAIDVLASGNVIAQNLAYGTGTAQPIDIESNLYDLTVVPTGLRDPIVFEMKTTRLEPDIVYTLVAFDKLASMRPMLLSTPSLTALLASGTPEANSAGTFYLRVVHAAPDAPTVDVYLDGNAAITGLTFGSATDFVELAVQNYDVAVRATGSPADSAPIFEVKSAPLGAPGQSVDLVAVGLLTGSGDQSFRLRIYAIDRSPTNGAARVQIVHASPDAPAVDVVAGDTVVAANLAYPNGMEGPISLTPNVYNLIVVPTGAKEPVLIDLKGVALSADTIYTLYTIGKLAEIKTLVLTTQDPTRNIISPAAEPTADTSGAPTPEALTAPTAEATPGG